jgi:hypothetical protein
MSARRDRESERILAGIGLVLVAVACFATLDTATKVSTIGVPILMGLWFRYAFQAVATTLVLLPRYGTEVLRTAHPRFQLLRGALLLASSTLAFLSLRYMPLAEFTSIVLIAPLVVTLLAALALKEDVSPLRWALVAAASPARSSSFARAEPSSAGRSCCRSRSSSPTPGSRSSPASWRGPKSRSPCTSTPAGSAPSRDDSAAVRVDRVAELELVGAALPHGADGDGRALLPDPRLPARARIDAHALPLRADRLRDDRRPVVFSHVPDRTSLVGMALIAVCGAAGAWLTVRERREPIEPAES